MFLVIVNQWSVGGCYGEILDKSMKKDMIVPSTSSNLELMASHGFVFRKLAKIQTLGHSVLKQGPQAVKGQLTSRTTGLVTSIWRVLGCPSRLEQTKLEGYRIWLLQHLQHRLQLENEAIWWWP